MTRFKTALASLEGPLGDCAAAAAIACRWTAVADCEDLGSLLPLDLCGILSGGDC